jgi:hypothetical protein
MRATLCALVALTGIASADNGFVQGVVGYSSPITGEQYMDGVESGSARFGVRGGYTPIQIGRVRLGVEGEVDWRPLQLANDYSTQQVRAMIGPRFAFVADKNEVFFRAVAGYDHLWLPGGTNDTGIAFEPGFGAATTYQQLIFGAEIAIPITYHREQTGDDYMDGFAGADFQFMLSVGSKL